MSVIPYNEFSSIGVLNVSSNPSSPSIVLSGSELADCGHIAIVSILVGNKTGDNRSLTLTIEKSEAALIYTLLPSISIPVNQSYDLLKEGSKIFLNKNDVIRAWTDQSNSLDLFVSYSTYTPSSLV